MGELNPYLDQREWQGGKIDSSDGSSFRLLENQSVTVRSCLRIPTCDSLDRIYENIANTQRNFAYHWVGEGFSAVNPIGRIENRRTLVDGFVPLHRHTKNVHPRRVNGTNGS